MSNTASAILACLLVAAAPAQTNWVVDSEGGPGSNFRSIVAALDAAAHGDIILVRAGTYSETTTRAWPTTGKGVTLVGEPGTVLSGDPSARFTVRGLPAGRTFAMRGFGFSRAGVLEIEGCDGLVHVEDINLYSGNSNPASRLIIKDSAQVCVSRVSVTGYNTVTATNSRVVFHRCTLDTVAKIFSAPALILSESDVSISRCTITGGPRVWTAPSPAIKMFGGRLSLAGYTSIISAGFTPYNEQVSAVAASAGRVEWDPTLDLRSAGGAAHFSGDASFVERRIPSLAINSLPRSGSWALGLSAPEGSLACLLVSLPSATVPTPFGELWISLSSHVVLGCQVVGSSEVFSLHVPIPDAAPGISLAVQGVVANGQTVELSTPVLSTVR